MIRAVLFDMDGTLVDSERYYLDGTYKWMCRYGFKGEIKDLYGIIGKTLDETYRFLSEMSGLSFDEVSRINEHYFLHEDPMRFDRYIFKESLPLLKTLHEQGIKLYVCSMSARFEVELCLKQTGLDRYVTDYLSFEDIVNPKPDPEIYLQALKRAGVRKDEALIVEDSGSGIASGKAAGIYTAARKDKEFGIDQSLADCIVDDLSEILDLVRSL